MSAAGSVENGSGGVLKRQEGVYGLSAFRGTVLRVKKTHIKDAGGNLAETIG